MMMMIESLKIWTSLKQGWEGVLILSWLAMDVMDWLINLILFINYAF